MVDVRRRIFNLFSEKKELSFSEIASATGLRSNHLAYYLKQLMNEGVLNNTDGIYCLSKAAEAILPQGDELLKLPVVVLAVENDDGKIALIERKKRPYAGYWALPGGRIRVDDTVESAARRIAREEVGMELDKVVLCGVVDEHLVDSFVVKNSWFLFLVRSRALSESRSVNWVAKADLDLVKIIPSDVWMIRELCNSTLAVHHVTMEENGRLYRLES